MRVPFSILANGLVAVIASSLPAQGAPAAADSTDPIKSMVAQLDLERYKATIKGLTQFGDRRQGTDRNQAAVEWIEKQLKSYGCADVERLTYDFQPPAPRAGGAGAAGAAGAAGRAGGAAGGRGGAPLVAQGGGRPRGVRTRTGVNSDSLAQTDPKLRALNAQPTGLSPAMRAGRIAVVSLFHGALL